MAVEIVIPQVGESVQEAILAEWFKQDGEQVAKDEPLFVIETDKVTLEVVAEVAGVLHIAVAEGETVAIGAVVGAIDPSAEGVQTAPARPEREEAPAAVDQAVAPPVMEPSAEPAPTPPVQAGESPGLPPSVRRLVTEKQLDIGRIQGTGPGGRITKGDVLLYLEQAPAGMPETCAPPAELELEAPPAEVRKKMTPIRKRIAARLVAAKQNTAMLTTFNDIDMGRVMAERSRYKEQFKQKHDVSLGFMSFFVKACVAALKEIPEINAFVEGDEIVYHNYQHIGVAIGSGKGLVVPVIRHAEKLGFADIEKAILDYVKKIQDNRLELADLEGGTFTISNGGVYGSLLSTPILNMPQSGILGMHRIEKRPVVVDDQIVVRPMMYVALSYDHRIVDGREAVTFLKRVKELIENPERLLLEV
ncbi:MAG: 2-oxoglutarate dehydrogenase complex dihydrolipoyllysine-residue succinyltransferase [Desulfobacteraceae bacterium]|jgi:2-oxoglutarate dehydrogenase E2 component (dihydrolipoamide succinyltransferase)